MFKIRLFALAVFAAAVAAPAASWAGSVTVVNCTSAQAKFASYNSNDTVKAIAAKDACLSGKDKSATLSCATGSCALKYWNNCGSIDIFGHGNFGASSGTMMFYDSKLFPLAAVLKDGIQKGILKAGAKSATCDQLIRMLAR